MVLAILTGRDNPVLRTKTKPVKKVTKDIVTALKDMRDTCDAERGAGIAAPQVGRSERMALTLIGKSLIAMINPVITWRSAEIVTAEEGCLSLPGIWIMVPRAKEIAVTYLNEHGKKQERRLKEWDARVVQHEVDHLDGVLIVDYQQ